MEPRVAALEDDLKELKAQVSRLNEALLGSLDGRHPGVIPLLHKVERSSEENGRSLSALSAQVETLRFDKAKVLGIVMTCCALFGALYKFVLK